MALAFGAAPGFAVPLVLPNRMPIATASAALIGISTAQIVYNVVASGYEMTLLARFTTSYASTADGGYTWRARSFVWRGVARFGPVSILLYVACAGALMAMTHSIGMGTMVQVCVVLAPVPAISVAASPFSAHLYSRGRLPAVYFSSFFRGAPTLAIALVDSSVAVIAATYLLGELMRAIYLDVLDREGDATAPASVAQPAWRDVSPLLVSGGIGQAMPSMIQAILALAGPVAVAQGTIALRLYGATVQVGTAVIAMPQVAAFANFLRSVDARSRQSEMRRTVARMLVWGGALATAVMAAVVLLRLLGQDIIPRTTATGIVWGLVPLVSVPASLTQVWAARGLVTFAMSKWIPLAGGAAALLGGLVSFCLLPFLGGLAALVGLCVFNVFGALMCTGLLIRHAPTFVLGNAATT
jgi:hypothetical protein